MTAPLTHHVFATASPYSHVPAAVRLSIRIVTRDPAARVSMIIHANNVLSATTILDAAPASVGRIKLWTVGERGAHKDQRRAYFEMVGGTGATYTQILRVSHPVSPRYPAQARHSPLGLYVGGSYRIRVRHHGVLARRGQDHGGSRVPAPCTCSSGGV